MRSSLLLVLFGSLLVVSTVMAATHVEIGEDVYGDLARLDAEGFLPGSLLSTKPLNRMEVMRLLLEAESFPPPDGTIARATLRRLRDRFPEESRENLYIKPLDRARASYTYLDSASQALNYNNSGYEYREGSNLRVDVATRAEWSWISGYARPEYRLSDGDGTFTLRTVYVSVEALGVELTAGRESLWWGPGYHGALLESNNAEPITMLRLTNPRAALLPWIFRFLGPFRFDFFAGRLEDDRQDVASPILWGLRFDLKPLPYLEIGLERTVIFGGEGHDEGWSAWWQSFTARGENDPGKDTGDQKAGMDIKVTIPWKVQPVQLYAEVAGEDSAGWEPSRRGYLGGIYLPRILGSDRVDFRSEFAYNHVKQQPNYWYNHHIYTQGYTYKGRIIGHHMGTDSRDLFAAASISVSPLLEKISVYYDREEHNLSFSVRETKDEIGVGVLLRPGSDIDLKVFYRNARVKNMGNVSGASENLSQVSAEVQYAF